MLTLFTTPVIYLYFDRMGERWRKRFGRREHRERFGLLADGDEPSPRPAPRGEAD
jgi:hypothetical protein